MTVSKLWRVRLLPLLALILWQALLGCDDQKSTDQRLRKGIWQQAGYGRTWVFDTKTLTIYSHNAGGCVRESQDNLASLYKTGQFMTRVEHDQMTVTGPAAKPYRLQRISALPESCRTPMNGEKDRLKNFDFFWHMMNEHYAFFAEHQIDWADVFKTQRPRIAAATSDEDVTNIYQDIIAQFPDAHVSLSLDRDHAFYGDAGAKGLALAFDKNPFFASDNVNGLEQFLNLQLDVADKLLLPGSRQESARLNEISPALVWGKLPNDIAYLRVHRLMALRSASEANGVEGSLLALKDDLNYVDQLTPEIVRTLSNTKGLIVDLRFNEGGEDQVGLRLVQLFNAQKHAIAYSQVNDSNSSEAIMLDAVASPYTKPIYVLIGGSTASAGEVMALALQTLPQVTIVGEPSYGIFSDVLAVSLPNGGIFGLSNEIYRDVNGDTPEGKGVQPHHKMPAYASFDLQMGVPTPLAFALQQMAPNTNATTAMALQQQLESIRQSTKFIGLSAAVIRNNKIVFEDGFGLADRSKDIAMTAHTPVNLASVSKTFVGTHLMQLAETQKIDLDAPLSSAELAFSIDNPNGANAMPTLRQLATHTSGIADNVAITQCQYFLEDGGSALYAALLPDTHPCTAPPLTHLAEYLTAYLSQTGSLYQTDHFIGAPGSVWSYSNTATALAGYAIEKHTGIPLTTSMTQMLFKPLGMNNTAWSRSQLSAVTPARLYTKFFNGDPNVVAREVPHYSYPDLYSGGIWSSAHDLAIYLGAISGGGLSNGTRLLSEQSVNTMLSSQTALSPHDKQGLFWIQTGGFIGHTGGDVGTQTWMFYTPFTNIGFVLLINQDGVEQLTNEGYLKPEQPLFDLLTALYRFGLGY